MIRRRFTGGTVAVVAVLVAASACAPSPGSGQIGYSFVCAPADAPLANVIINVISAPPGASVSVSRLDEFRDHSETLYFERTFFDVVAGGTYSVYENQGQGALLLDAGLCLRVSPGDGVVYTTTAVPVDPLTNLLYSLGQLRAVYTRGWPPPTYRNIPVDVTGVTGATDVTAGERHSCAVVTGGAVTCWGSNSDGQLGDGTNVGGSQPVAVSGLTGATSVDGGDDHTCAVMTGGVLKCWGANDTGQLGDGTNNASQLPVDVVGISGATQIGAGAGFTCALLAGGTVSCWGANTDGVLGTGTFGGGTESNVPVVVPGIADATQLAVGASHACAIVTAGSVKCWGRNAEGQLGIGTTDARSLVPTDVIGVTGATDLSAGELHTCAVVAGGATKCWGRNNYGQLGDGTTGFSSIVPVDATGLAGATQVAGGKWHTCALVADGTATCWGRNVWGQLGTGNYVDSLTPVEVTRITGATGIEAGDHHSCAIVSGGAVKCWGYNDQGQLGNG